MTKKPFSLIIEDGETIPPYKPEKPPKGKKRGDKGAKDKPRFSIMDNNTEEKPEETPHKQKLFYSNIKNYGKFLHRTYGVKITYNNKKSIHYLLEVKCEGVEKDVFSYTLTRKRFFKNGKALDGFIEKLAEQSANCLYPLQVNTNKEGQIIQVTNQKDILKRWQALKPELSKRYTGKPFADHCQQLEKAISTPEHLLKSLNNDVVYDILFNKLYLKYTRAFRQPLEKRFKWFSGAEKLRFTGHQSVNRVLTKSMRIAIDYKGILQPIAGITKGETTIKYQLNSKDHTLLRVNGVFNYTNKSKSNTIHFSAIWQQNSDKTEEREIEDKKRKGIYIPPGAKWWQLWKH